MEDSTSVKAEINTTGGGYFMGDVGIGTTSPQRTLHVHDDSTYIQITNDTTGTASGDGLGLAVLAISVTIPLKILSP